MKTTDKNIILFNRGFIPLFVIITSLFSCQKDEAVITDSSHIKWISILNENVSGSTEDDGILGQNGKVLTDEQDNIYVYYFKELEQQTIVLKCNSAGSMIWKKITGDCIPMDMVLRPDGKLIVAVRDYPGHENKVVLLEFLSDGTMSTHPLVHVNMGNSIGVFSASMYAMPDNSIAMCGVYLSQFLVGAPVSHEGYFLQIDASYNKLWNFVSLFINTGNSTAWYEQSSIVPADNGKFLAQMSYKGDPGQSDNLKFGYMTVLTRSDTAAAETAIFYNTGYYEQSTGNYNGYYNRYSNYLIKTPSGENIHFFSAPSAVLPGAPFFTSVRNGFIRIGNDAEIKDTIPFDLPSNYRVISCTKGRNGFLMTAYKVGGIDVVGDFSANQTLILTGNNNWQVTSSFKFQNFYADFFPSSAPTSDGSYILFGKIQSYNGPKNKLALIKWDPEI